MKETKDLFSVQSATYAAYRPVYPDELYTFLYSKCLAFDAAWDCGTGNGQVASRLAERFGKVTGTDISGQQIANAINKPNIKYIVCRAEQTPLADNSIDLVTVGTALHWFDFEHFYKEVARVAKQGALFAAWCYGTCRVDKTIDDIYDYLYTDITGNYWSPERRYVDDGYQSIPFPFREIETPALVIKAHWKKEQYTGYLQSWSAVQHYIKQNGKNPVELVTGRIEDNWDENEEKEITFPIYMRAGYIK